MIKDQWQDVVDEVYSWASLPRELEEDTLLRPLTSNRSSRNQFVILIKPEATAIRQGVDFRKIVDLLQGKLQEHRVEVGGLRVVSGGTLERIGTMESHYGVINRISRLGLAALSVKARAEFDARFGSAVAEGAEVLGGHAFLDRFPNYSPFRLSTLFAEVGSTRLAAGSYACRAVVEGQSVVILNGFHPYQLQRFTNAEAMTVIVEGLTDTPWVELRERLVGATDPRLASAGSLREIILRNAPEYGLKEVSQNANGFHLSAGPVEGMVEVRRFFSADGRGGNVPIDVTVLGSRLLERGAERSFIESFSSNPKLVRGDRSEPIFDATEEMDGDVALEFLLGDGV